MRLLGTHRSLLDCKSENGCGGLGGADCVGGDGSGGGDGGEQSAAATVVVGVRLDSRSRELLTWALVKVAQSGDRVIALHVIDPNTDKSTLLSMVKTFDSVLAAYEGFCNLKQVDLKLKVCRGSPIRKVIAREANSCGVTHLIVGTSETNHTIRSSVSVAKYCARNLLKNISVTAVDNGKIAFQREATSLSSTNKQGSLAAQSKRKRRKSLAKSPLSLEPKIEDDCEQNSSDEDKNAMALVPFKPQDVPRPKPGWALIRKVFLHNKKPSEKSSSKKSSIKDWILKLPSRQSFSAIYPDHKQSSSDVECSTPDLDEEKGAIVPYGTSTTFVPDSPAYSMKSLPKELEGLPERYSSTCRLFNYEELLWATSNFVPENMIGKGGSSQVYKGCLPDGRELAVKILKPSEDVLKQFVSEIEIITALHHKNIISLFGFCFEENKLLLVYDLLARGSLEDNLHGNGKTSKTFGWEDRYKVAVGVAEALEHLHGAAAEPIIHRDVKSSNILLGDDFEPQLSDFGLATWASSSSYHLESIDVAGTFGYLAPEYFMHGKVNEKIDVYAFGVVLLELLSGRKPIDNGESLVMWARNILKSGTALQLLDPCLTDAYNHDQFEQMLLAATLCIRRSSLVRPHISLVVKLLQGDLEVIDWAREQVSAPEEVDAVDGEQSSTNIQSFINLALLNLEDDSLSSSSTEQAISVEDYLQGRWSRSSSFN